MSIEFALYDAFSEQPFGGSQAAIITDAGAIPAEQRPAIARELGMPATAFVDAIDGDLIRAQFWSTVMELPMCGHGTVCLMTHLVETGLISLEPDQCKDCRLQLPDATARVSLEYREDKRICVMLDVVPSRFKSAPEDRDELAKVLGIDESDFAPDLDPETARGDFVHLVLPLSGLAAMHRLKPDFGAIVDYCHRYGLETIVVFCLETEDSQCDLHVRDFCPAVGVSESAAAGTTNAALTCYLLRHELITGNDSRISINAEQGIELGRPSRIHSQVRLHGSNINRLQVGGVATRVLQGQILI